MNTITARPGMGLMLDKRPPEELTTAELKARIRAKADFAVEWRRQWRKRTVMIGVDFGEEGK